MSLLITILQAAHCRSTHQFFVLDALPLVTTPRGNLLQKVLLKHYDEYLVGSKAPDKEFRDFRNHVVHVRDNYWGGAPKLAEAWYEKLLGQLDAGQWSQAAYAAGVLSHYFTDPLMPLHTAQSEIESVVHRPLEWSVCKSYQRIHRRWSEGNHKIVFELATGPGWLGKAVRRGAQVANRYYEQLIQRYDLKAGVRKPTAGFDQASIDILAGLFGLAITGWARILERAADETTATIPQVSIAPETILATIKIPTAWITRKIESSAERRAVQAIFDEYQSTGTVKDNLPAEVREVKSEFARDQAVARKTQLASNQAASVQRIDQPQPVATKHNIPESATPPMASPGSVREHRIDNSHSQSQQRGPRLQQSDNLVDAPSIGPKTAKRFAAIGITTVAQFLEATPEQMERQLKTTWITATKIGDWQSQARLVCAIPSLCGYKAKLLVAVGCHTTEAIAARSASKLHLDIEKYSRTSDGRRILRNSKVPKVDDVKQWVSDAKEVVQSRMSA